jgi:hypothetical protein
LPSSVGALNITMGYPSKNNPQILIANYSRCILTHWLEMQKIMCCIKDVLDILTHPLVEPYAQTSTLVNLINKNNYTFITHHKLMELNPTDLFLLLFQNGKRARLLS